jgi:hypothetical protein
MRLFRNAAIELPDQLPPGPRRAARRRRIARDLVKVVSTGFRGAECLACLVDGIDIETRFAALTRYMVGIPRIDLGFPIPDDKQASKLSQRSSRISQHDQVQSQSHGRRHGVRLHHRGGVPRLSMGPAWPYFFARLAEKRMTPEAKASVAALLESSESLADASLWADESRGRPCHIAPWHYVDVPLDQAKYDPKFSADDTRHGCVVDKINEFRKVVGDKSKSVEERRFALRFLIHCIQDLHQPCHVGDNHDRGGNDTQVRWFDTGSNLHKVWDSGIVESYFPQIAM